MAIATIYGQTLGFALLYYDDNEFVFANSHVAPGLTASGIHWAFTDGPFGEWYPLAMLSHMLDCQIFGSSAWGHHLTSVLLHAAASIALFLVLWRMTTELWPSAAVVAILFAVHPQHVESVAWIAERRDVLSGLFFVLTLAAYLGYVRRGRWWPYYGLLLLLFALGLMAKAMLVTLPALLLLLDFWPLSRWGAAADTPDWTRSLTRPSLGRLLWEKVPLFALAVGDALITLRTHGIEGAALAWPARIGNAAVFYVTYLIQFFYPVDLAVYYPYPTGLLPAWQVIGSVAILAIASIAAVIARRRYPWFFVGWFWYLGMLLPVIGLSHVVAIATADRYMYLSGIGLCIGLVWGVARASARLPQRRAILTASAAVASLLLTAAAWRQTSFWHDDETLWRHALAVTSDNGQAETMLADALVRDNRFDDAIALYRQAELHPCTSAPFNNLGNILSSQGKLDEAIDQYRQGLKLSQTSSDLYANLGTALALQKQDGEARQSFERAVAINPQAMIAAAGIAPVCSPTREKPPKPASGWKRQSRSSQAIPPTGTIWPSCSSSKKLYDEAIEQLEAALTINHADVRAHLGLTAALATQGRFADALAHCRQALEIEPQNPLAIQYRDRLLSQGGETSPP